MSALKLNLAAPKTSMPKLKLAGAMSSVKMSMPKPFSSFPTSSAGMGMKRLALKKIVKSGTAQKTSTRKAFLGGMAAKPITGQLKGGMKGISGSIKAGVQQFGKNPSMNVADINNGGKGSNLGTSGAF